MKRQGTIFTYSIVRSGTEAFQEMTPYVLALVEEENLRSMARIEGYTDKTNITIGMKVTFLKDDIRGNPIYTFGSV